MQLDKLSRQRIGMVTTMNPTRIAATALVVLLLTTRVAQPTDPTKDNPIEELMELIASPKINEIAKTIGIIVNESKAATEELKHEYDRYYELFGLKKRNRESE